MGSLYQIYVVAVLGCLRPAVVIGGFRCILENFHLARESYWFRPKMTILVS